MSRVAGKSIWGPQRCWMILTAPLYPLFSTWGSCWNSKKNHIPAKLLQCITSNFSQGKTQTPGVFKSDCFPSLVAGRKVVLGTGTSSPSILLTSPPLPWFATWRQINVIQAPLPGNISASWIPSRLPTDPGQQSKARALLMEKDEVTVRWARPQQRQ